ncbi:MAG: L-threonylcarbamoyladenylate synthase [bacterium]|nr:L-threonylcarbamoyladenylate synthase [bacterium]
MLQVATVLQRGGLAVIPTDTIYGIVACALDKKAVTRLYRIRRLPASLSHAGQAGKTLKPFIILIGGVTELRSFGVTVTAAQKKFLERVWPGKVSVILPCKAKKFSYLHLGTKTLAFRLPRSKNLQALLTKTGPLVAPSVNPEGKEPAKTIAEARKYFGDSVDIYISAEKKSSGRPSTLVSLLTSEPRILREGAVKILL